jgi:hypothetical protein
LISDSFKYAEAYVTNHPILLYVDNPVFRTAVSTLFNDTQNEIGRYINEAMYSFNTGVTNSMIDYQESATSLSDPTPVNDLVSSLSDKLSVFSQEQLSKVEELVNSHSFDRPLLRPTGNRGMPTGIKLNGSTTFSYEVQNVGTKPWTGWLCLTLTDEYKKVISECSAPQSLTVINPGEISNLSRSVTVPKVLSVKGLPRSWGNKTKVSISIYTRK